MNIRLNRLNSDARIPKYQHTGDSGCDLYPLVMKEDIDTWFVPLNPGQIHIFDTGLSLEIPPMFEGQIRSRSGLACKHGICVVNAPGTIDSTYRGNIRVALINHSNNLYVIKSDTRIAQLVIAPVVHSVQFIEEMLGATKRGSGGFGSTKGM